MNNSNQVCQLCNKIEFAVFKIKDIISYCEAKKLCNKQELHAQKKLTFQKLFLKNMEKASSAKSEANPIKKILNPINFVIINIQNC